MKSAFLIAAPMSGSGKTTIARGLMGLLTQKGYRVQPFKCGPDYIDTKFHASACGRPSVNLDTFMATPEHVASLFRHYGKDADVCIVEGMMGLYDGYERHRGSSAEIASVLDIPVVLVVSARSAAYSMAALLQGFVHFREDVRIAGVIFNKVGSQRHLKVLQEVCDDLHIDCFGFLPDSPALEQQSRYLGLDFSETTGSQELTDLLDRHIAWQRLTDEASRLCGTGGWAGEASRLCGTGGWAGEGMGEVAVIARNGEAFSFIYQETLDGFASKRYFDPEQDVPDLSDASLLYLPGGYPENHAEALAKNEACRKAIRDYAERGGRIVAECGGMMYLCQSIVADADSAYPMCAVLPYTITARKADRRLSLGYRTFVLDGCEYRGHEFHYTQFMDPVPRSAAQVYNAQGEPVATPVLRYKNVLASYTHLYAGCLLNETKRK